MENPECCWAQFVAKFASYFSSLSPHAVQYWQNLWHGGFRENSPSSERDDSLTHPQRLGSFVLSSVPTGTSKEHDSTHEERACGR